MDEREIIWVGLYDDYNPEFRKTLPEAVEWLQGHLAKVPAEFRDDSLFEVEFERGMFDSGDSCTMKIGYHRPETDEEYADRLAQVERSRVQQQAHQEATERATFEALKRKYG